MIQVKILTHSNHFLYINQSRHIKHVIYLNNPVYLIVQTNLTVTFDPTKLNKKNRFVHRVKK